MRSAKRYVLRNHNISRYSLKDKIINRVRIDEYKKNGKRSKIYWVVGALMVHRGVGGRYYTVTEGEGSTPNQAWRHCAEEMRYWINVYRTW
jgi:hypothetical protein